MQRFVFGGLPEDAIDENLDVNRKKKSLPKSHIFMGDFGCITPLIQ